MNVFCAILPGVQRRRCHCRESTVRSGTTLCVFSAIVCMVYTACFGIGVRGGRGWGRQAVMTGTSYCQRSSQHPLPQAHNALARAAGINAPGPQCQCFMPAFVACMGSPAQPQPAHSQPSHKQSHRQKQGQKRELPPGHSKRYLGEELDIDSRMHQGSLGTVAFCAGRSAALAASFLLIVQPVSFHAQCPQDGSK